MMDAERDRITQIVAGDMKAFQALIEDYQRLVCHVVFRMVLNEEDREEICQDVFVKVYRNLEKFEFKSKFSTWIARIAYNTAVNYLRKKKLPLYEDYKTEPEDKSKRSGETQSYIEKVAGDEIQADEWVMNKEVFKFLQTEIDALPPQYRTILTLYHINEMRYQEICEIMDLPEGTVKSYLFRARKLLKERMLANYPAEELW